MKAVWRDARLGVRSLSKSPGFTVVALLTLALGIGANTAIFSAVDRILLHPLPYPQPGRIVSITRSGELLPLPRKPAVMPPVAPGPASLPSATQPAPGGLRRLKEGSSLRPVTGRAPIGRLRKGGPEPLPSGKGNVLFGPTRLGEAGQAQGSREKAPASAAGLPAMRTSAAGSPAPRGPVRERRMLAGPGAKPGHGRLFTSFSYPDFTDLRSQATAFEEVAAYHGGQVTLTKRGEPASIPAVVSSASLFPLLRVQALLGRLYTSKDDVEGAPPVAVISEGLWRTRFGASPNALGQVIELNSETYTIVGVLPGSLAFPPLASPADVWIPLVSDPEAQLETARHTRGLMYLQVLGRLKPGVSLPRANAQLATIADRLTRSYPLEPASGMSAAPLAEQLVRSYRLGLLVLLASVGLVLLIACVNVANLLLARATIRERELALRLALGSHRAGIVRQMLIEGLELSVAGGALGVFLAYGALAVFEAHLPPMLRQFQELSVNGSVLGFAGAASIAAGVLIALVPAWRLSDLRVSETLKQSGSGAGAAPGKGRLRGALVMLEVALAVILLAGAGLLLRSFGKLVAVPLGFQPRGVLMAEVNLSAAGYKDPGQWTSFVQTALDRLRAQPGVLMAAAATAPPMSGMLMIRTFSIPGQPLPPDQTPSADFRAVSPGYFGLMRVPLLRGRTFAATDAPTSAPVCIVDQAFVARYFPGLDPLSQQIVVAKPQAPCQIVGVVGNTVSAALSAAPSPTMYLPFAQSPFFAPAFLLRAEGDPAGLIPGMREEIQSLNATLPVMPVPLTNLVTGSVEQARLRAELVAVFAVLAILLAAMGISGVLGYSVTRRTQEIGVRMALGATPGEVVGLVLREGLFLVGVGAVAGIVGALGLTRLLASLLFHVSPADPLTYAAVALVLLAVALLACALPALRAARVDPTVTLRYE